VDALRKDTEVIGLVRAAHERGKKVWSVCTGGLVLAEAGLLRGRKAVTHHEHLDELQEMGAKVVRKRVVRDGNIVTAGGISSSIDLGLELVKDELGREVARLTGERMEYPPPKA